MEDERPGTAAARLPAPHFSVLTWRIIFFNAVALVILLGGVMLVQSSRVGLVEERMQGIRQQTQIVASTLAEYATDEEARHVRVAEAEPLLRQLIAPTRLRARLYDTNGMLLIDTRNLLSRNIVQHADLPPLDAWSQTMLAARHLYDNIIGVRPFSRPAPYFEAGDDGRVYGEVTASLAGETASAERVDEQNRLVLSVAMPVQRLKAIYGSLFVSTEGGDIDDILRAERAALIEVFLVAFAVMVISSLYLAGTIAVPVRRLAETADRVRRGLSGRETISAILEAAPERGDEIGDLSASLSAMTRALYERIDAIESFAADVAHEIKNPLTSMKSAIDMLSRTDEADARARLMAVVRNDVKRIDRLITDISDASRLDAELSREAALRVDLVPLLSTIVEIYRLTGTARGVEIVLNTGTVAPVMVVGRDERLGQVFRNLIDNAVSFSPDGGTVTIGLELGAQRARVTVEDEGPGIPPENLESIFERFYTERPSDSFGTHSGLGLFIARQIANRAGGRMWAENRNHEGKGGARMVVELPLAGRAA